MRFVLTVTLLGMAACSSSWPVAVIGQHGDVLTGSATASLSVGTFAVSNGKLSCTGAYDPLDLSVTLNFTVLCTDGRRGFGTVVREASGQAGQGNVHLEDGENAAFIFGSHAAVFVPKVGTH